MRNMKKYEVPAAEVTIFECVEDIMTASNTLRKTIDEEGSGKAYVKLEGKSWSDIYGK